MPNVKTAGLVAVCGVKKLCQSRKPRGITAMYSVNATQAPMTIHFQFSARRVDVSGAPTDADAHCAR